MDAQSRYRYRIRSKERDYTMPESCPTFEEEILRVFDLIADADKRPTPDALIDIRSALLSAVSAAVSASPNESLAESSEAGTLVLELGDGATPLPAGAEGITEIENSTGELLRIQVGSGMLPAPGSLQISIDQGDTAAITKTSPGAGLSFKLARHEIYNPCLHHPPGTLCLTPPELIRSEHSADATAATLDWPPRLRIERTDDGFRLTN
jgi:hypothetical protein